MVHLRVRRATVLLFAVICITVLFACTSPKPAAEIGEITDVVIHDKYVFFDNTYHGLDIEGLRDGDVVLYSEVEDGVFSLTEPKYKDVGVYAIYVKITREGCNDLVVSATLTISVRTIDGISSTDTVAEYDGLNHSVPLVGVRDGDNVAYSIDGETFSSDLELIEVGEYVVFYIVTRDHAEFRGSCNLTILPSASGKYFNSTHGVISINGFSTSDGLTVSYDLSGVGLIGDKPFSLSDNSITVDGVEYERIDDSDTVHTLTVNGSVVMYFNEAEVNIGVTFDDKGANISINSSVISFPDFNYCESINSTVNDGHACGMTSTVSSEDINIVLSERKTNAFENPYLLCVYDGKPHAFSDEALMYEVDGKFVAESPSFTEIGTYTVKVLSIKSAYLPAYGTATLVIAPSPDGVYYSVEDKTVIRIENAQAVKNGTAVELSYTENRWAVDGVLLSEYTALTDGMIFVISVDNVIADIVLDTGNIKHVASDGANAALLGEEFKILGTFLFSHEITEVYFNGVKKSPIQLPNYDALYGIGISDIESANGVLNINFC